jgi:hypothetical protein
VARRVGLLPAEERVLHRVLGVGARRQHPVGEPMRAGLTLFEHVRMHAFWHVWHVASHGADKGVTIDRAIM